MTSPKTDKEPSPKPAHPVDILTNIAVVVLSGYALGVLLDLSPVQAAFIGCGILIAANEAYLRVRGRPEEAPIRRVKNAVS